MEYGTQMRQIPLGTGAFLCVLGSGNLWSSAVYILEGRRGRPPPRENTKSEVPFGSERGPVASKREQADPFAAESPVRLFREKKKINQAWGWGFGSMVLQGQVKVPSSIPDTTHTHTKINRACVLKLQFFFTVLKFSIFLSPFYLPLFLLSYLRLSFERWSPQAQRHWLAQGHPI